jgi:hypothetical protein
MLLLLLIIIIIIVLVPLILLSSMDYYLVSVTGKSECNGLARFMHDRTRFKQQ